MEQNEVLEIMKRDADGFLILNFLHHNRPWLHRQSELAREAVVGLYAECERLRCALAKAGAA